MNLIITARQLFNSLRGKPGMISLAAPTKNNSRVSYQLQKRYVFRVEMEMDTWRRAIIYAEDPLLYDRRTLYALYRQIMLDAQVFSQFRTILNTVISESFEVQNSTGTIDEEKTELLKRPWFDHYIKLFLETELFGHSLVEFGPLNEKGEFDLVQLIPREHVKPETGILLFDPNVIAKGIPFREPPFNTWLVEMGDHYDLGILRVIAREVIWKLYSRTDWSRHSEKFGMPFVVVKSASNQEAELQKKEDMLANFGSNSYAILDNDDEIQLLETAKTDAYQIYLQLATFCDDQISKGINGQTGSSDQKAFVGAAQVHERLLDDYTRARLRALEYHVNFVLFPFLIDKGYQLDGYKFQYPGLTKEPDPTPQEPTNNDNQDQGGSLSLKKKDYPSLTLSLNKLYTGCGHDHHELAAVNPEDYQSEIERLAKAIHDGDLSAGMLDADFQMKVTEAVTKDFFNSYNKPIGNISYTLPDNNFIGRIQNNIFSFFGAKNLNMISEMASKVYQDGKLVPWTQFRDYAMSINEKYYSSWITAERNAVMRAGTMGSKWMDIEQDKDLYPYLTYRTVGDDRVREEHAALEGITLPVDDPFWTYNYPPNGWNCRCTVDQKPGHLVDKPSDSKRAGQLGKESTDPQFRTNVGKTNIVFENDHPYFSAYPGSKLVSLDAVLNYRMKTLEDIYSRVEKLPKTQGFESKSDFDNWYGDVQTKRSNIMNTEVLFDTEFRDHLPVDRLSYTKEIFNVFHSPDEVYYQWVQGKKFSSERFTVFLKYYQEKPIVLLVDANNKARSFYMAKDMDRAKSFRKGILRYKK